MITDFGAWCDWCHKDLDLDINDEPINYYCQLYHWCFCSKDCKDAWMRLDLNKLMIQRLQAEEKAEEYKCIMGD